MKLYLLNLNSLYGDYLTWQDIYATVHDNRRLIRSHTSSRLGKVNWVNANINSSFGEVLNATATYKSLPRPDFVSDQVIVNLDLNPNPAYVFSINGFELSNAAISNLCKRENELFELSIKSIENHIKSLQMISMIKTEG